jgi:cytochrome c biogenesis protein CcmG/thiol:disulfide interchange protein DsbE
MKVKILLIIIIIAIVILLRKIELSNVPKQVITIKEVQNITDFNMKSHLPNFTVSSIIKDQLINSTDIKEDIILLNFWASWCLPCRVELPAMLKLVKDSAGNVALFTISIDKESQDAVRFLKKIGIRDLHKINNTYWGWDPHQIISLKKFNSKKIPETIIINKERLMLKKVIGVIDWQALEIKKFMQ